MLTFFMSTAGLEGGSREQSVNVVVGDEDETFVTGPCHSHDTASR